MLTQETFAWRLGVGAGVFSRSESAERNWSDDAVERRFAVRFGDASGADRVAGLVAIPALVRGILVLVRGRVIWIEEYRIVAEHHGM
jgi:hypothetical protein